MNPNYFRIATMPVLFLPFKPKANTTERGTKTTFGGCFYLSNQRLIQLQRASIGYAHRCFYLSTKEHKIFLC